MPAKKADRMAWFKMDAGAFMTDTIGLSLRHAGAYARLLNLYWMGGNKLPSDINVLMRKLGATTEEDRAVAGEVLDEFFPVADDGLRHHHNLDLQLEDVIQVSQVRRKAASSRQAEGKQNQSPLAADQTGESDPDDDDF